MAYDLKIEPGALERVAAAISDAGVNISAATCTGPAEVAELHILVPHAEAVKHALAISNLAVTGEREVVVVEAHDMPGELVPDCGVVQVFFGRAGGFGGRTRSVAIS